MHSNSSHVTVICPVCDTPFHIHPYRAKSGTTPTCSRECANAVRFGTLEERFRQNFTEGADDTCWEWQGLTDAYGYGSLRSRYRRLKAHRVSYEIYVGAIPDSLHVLHRCDNPGCVNPNHLFLGTHAENMADKERKGRGRSGVTLGTKNHAAKLTPDSVVELRRLHASGSSLSDLARRFGVTKQSVAAIVSRKSWKHVT